MAPGTARTLRNVAIVVAIALVVWLVPGGETSAGVVSNLVSLLFVGALLVLGIRLYREWGASLDGLPVRVRALLFGGLALAAFALVAANRLWDSGLGVVLWVGLVAAAVYGVFTAVTALRSSY